MAVDLSYGSLAAARETGGQVNCHNIQWLHGDLLSLPLANGTLLTSGIIERLAYQCGTLVFSIDAVGELFNQVRFGASWAKVDRNVRALIKNRRAEMLKVAIYPTVSRRTLSHMLPVAQWAAEVGVDDVWFHRYYTSPWCTEERPTKEELAVQKEILLKWKEKYPGGPNVTADGEEIGVSKGSTQQCALHRPQAPWVTYPRLTGQHHCHPIYLCATPTQFVALGLDGEFYACIRTQEPATIMGYATSVEEFAAAWFGYNYRAIRKSLMHGSRFPRPIARCESCIELFTK